VHVDLVVAKVITMCLGFLVAHQAYVGYRTHGSDAMLYVAIGFLVVSVGAVIEGVLFEVVGLTIYQAGTVQTSIVAAGMVVILYSLYGDLEESQQSGDGTTVHRVKVSSEPTDEPGETGLKAPGEGEQGEGSASQPARRNHADGSPADRDREATEQTDTEENEQTDTEENEQTDTEENDTRND
jgi:hypothetical protein